MQSIIITPTAGNVQPPSSFQAGTELNSGDSPVVSFETSPKAPGWGVVSQTHQNQTSVSRRPNNGNDTAGQTFHSQLRKAQQQGDDRDIENTQTSATASGETKTEAETKTPATTQEPGKTDDAQPAGEDAPADSELSAGTISQADPTAIAAQGQIPSTAAMPQPTKVKVKPALPADANLDGNAQSAGAEATSDTAGTPNKASLTDSAGQHNNINVTISPQIAPWNAAAIPGNNDLSPATKTANDTPTAAPQARKAAAMPSTAAVYSQQAGQTATTNASVATDGITPADPAVGLAQPAGIAPIVANPSIAIGATNNPLSGQIPAAGASDSAGLAVKPAWPQTPKTETNTKTVAFQAPASQAQLAEIAAESQEAAKAAGDETGLGLDTPQKGQLDGKIFRIGTEVSSALAAWPADSPAAGGEIFSQSLLQTSPTSQVSLAGQIADSFTSAAGAGGRVVVKLNPPELGKVQMTVQEEVGGLRCVLKVDNPRTLDQLKGEIAALTQRLEDSGIQVKHVEVALFNSSGGHSGEPQNFANRHGDSSPAYSAFGENGSSRGQGSPGSYSQGRPGQAFEAQPQLARNLLGTPTDAASVRDGGINVWL